jgi:hypothetical protein
MDRMLTSLHIRGFKGFDDLRIEHLGRVNLIVGKNNVGKTALLEAIRIYASGGDLSVMRSILGERDEFERVGQDADGRPAIRGRWSSLFGGWPSPYTDAQFCIAAVNSELTLTVSQGPPTSNEGRHSANVRLTTSTGGDAPVVEQEPELAVRIGEWTARVPFAQLETATAPWRPAADVAFVSGSGLSSSTVVSTWDRSALGSGADRIREFLSPLADIERIHLAQHPTRPADRVPWIRVAGVAEESQPIRSLGAGVARAFHYALAMEAAASFEEGTKRRAFMRDKYTPLSHRVLLIDEVENGLHYTVLPDIWRLLFAAALAADVQVFATTHSWDAFVAFARAAAESDAEGVAVRLERQHQGIVAIEMNEDDLRVIARSRIEVR